MFAQGAFRAPSERRGGGGGGPSKGDCPGRVVRVASFFFPPLAVDPLSTLSFSSRSFEIVAQGIAARPTTCMAALPRGGVASSSKPSKPLLPQGRQRHQPRGGRFSSPSSSSSFSHRRHSSSASSSPSFLMASPSSSKMAAPAAGNDVVVGNNAEGSDDWRRQMTSEAAEGKMKGREKDRKSLHANHFFFLSTTHLNLNPFLPSLSLFQRN